MFKVEVYPCGSGGNDGPAVTHYACLAAAAATTTTSSTNSNNTTGCIWTMGRKQGDYIASMDKSVSREHAQLCVISANKTVTDDHGTASASAASNNKKPGPCVTPEQIEACQNDSDHQMCLVLRNLGKLGSYLVVVPPPQQDDSEKDKKKKATKDDDDSDTANTEEVAQSQSQAMMVVDVSLSEISKKWAGSNRAKLQMIPCGSSVVLVPETTTTDNDGKKKKVMMSSSSSIFQCGKMGTTVVVTRLKFRFVASGGVKKELAKLQHSLMYSIGGTVQDELFVDDDTANIDDSSSTKNNNNTKTYLVTDKYNICLKQLTAWSSGIPIVDLSFVRALLERTSCSDALPNPANHRPKPDTENNDFWQTIKPHRQLWKSCVLLATSPKDVEYENLVKAVGGRVEHLYDVDTGTILSETDALAKIEPYQKNDDDNSLACFMVNSRRKLTKTLKEQHGIPVISGKEFALAIMNQRLLQDSNGESIGHVVEAVDESEQKSSPPPPPPEATVEQSAAATKSDQEMLTDAKTEDPRKHQDSATAAKSGDKEDDREPVATTGKRSSRKHARDESVPTESASKTKSRRDESATANETKEMSATKSTEKLQDTEPIAAEQQEDNEFPVPDEDDVEMEDTTKTQGGSDQQKENEKSKQRTGASKKPRPKRKPLDTSQGGWMTALPQGEKRKKFLRTKAEIQELTGVDEVRPVAPTDFVKGLVVASDPPPQQETDTARAVTPSSGPNFKAFRKNSVPPVHTTFVALRSVLPKESEHQRDVEEQRHAMEAQQRRADELFRDNAGTTKGRRRRR